MQIKFFVLGFTLLLIIGGVYVWYRVQRPEIVTVDHQQLEDDELDWENVSFGGYVFEYPSTWTHEEGLEEILFLSDSKVIAQLQCPTRPTGFELWELTYEATRQLQSAAKISHIDYWNLKAGEPNLPDYTLIAINRQELGEGTCSMLLQASHPNYVESEARGLFSRIGIAQ